MDLDNIPTPGSAAYTSPDGDDEMDEDEADAETGAEAANQ